jgi:hypothetical protein
MPRSALQNAEGLIDEFKAGCRKKLELKNAPSRPGSGEGGLATARTDILGKKTHKKQRGRPRKQV